ncbi:MAG TPA: MBL fold metallo-hydrolase [Gammaproteobacteria bacterium]|nr:MBL fold metallo-hydrolase [Gammaproteobacteria bacterium]
MKVEFFGVRGSMASPGSNTHIFGGNTSCVYIEQNNGKDLILDSGTGIVELGTRLLEKEHPITILLTHNHWDHIQGFPFFRPIMDPDVKIIFLNDEGATVSDAVLGQMDGVRFPITRNELKANIVCGSQDYQSAFDLFGVTCTEVNMLHEGACFGFRVTRDDGDWVYMTDNELPADVQSDEMHRLVDFTSSADVLIHDA